MKTILFPTDFSENSKNAFIYALHLAEKLEAEILMFHMFQHAVIDEAFVPIELIEALLSEKQHEAMKHFASYEQQVQEELGKQIPVRHQLKEGAPVPGIIEAAGKIEPYMIVMGTLGSKSLAEKILGSVTSQVINKANCPVLAVPEGAVYHGFKRITYATDFQQAEGQAIERLLEFGKMFDAHLDCVHIHTYEGYWEELNMDFFKQIMTWEANEPNLSFFTLKHQEVHTGLNKFVHERESDLLAMLTHKREPFTTIYNSSITRNMVLFSDIPLLAFK